MHKEKIISYRGHNISYKCQKYWIFGKPYELLSRAMKAIDNFENGLQDNQRQV